MKRKNKKKGFFGKIKRFFDELFCKKGCYTCEHSMEVNHEFKCTIHDREDINKCLDNLYEDWKPKDNYNDIKKM